MTGFLAVMTANAIGLAVVSGAIGGIYMAIVHPTANRRVAAFRGIELAIVGTMLYAARIGFAAAGEQPDIGRIFGGWTLWLIFAGTLGLVAVVGARRWRKERERGSTAT